MEIRKTTTDKFEQWEVKCFDWEIPSLFNHELMTDLINTNNENRNSKETR